MAYYAVQVATRGETRYATLCRRLDDFVAATLLVPRRSLTIRRFGKQRVELSPIFPGYVFVEAESIDSRLFRAIRDTPGFRRFLKSNDDIQPLAGQDRDLLAHFLSFGELVRPSRVRFDVNSKIIVVDGPLTGLEGRIVRVDRRKKRAKVRMDMYSETFLVDLGIDVLDEASGPRQEEGAAFERES